MGIHYNVPPFGWLDSRGNITGFDADLMRLIADDWGVNLHFRQVTRHTGPGMLLEGAVDLLAGGQPLLGEQSSHYEFSHIYHQDRLVLLVRAESAWQSTEELSEQGIGVLQVSLMEDYLEIWQLRENVTFAVKPQPTHDHGIKALLAGEIEALFIERSRIHNLEIEPGSLRELTTDLGALPIAFISRQQDGALRDAINHALQSLSAKGNLRALHAFYFPQEPFNPELIPRWAGLGETTKVVMATGIQQPENLRLPQIRQTGIVRIALPPDSSLTDFHLGLAQALAELWGVAIETLTLDTEQAKAALLSNAADLAFSIAPNWSHSAQLDYSAPYLRHGLLLVARSESEIGGFNDLPERALIAIPTSDSTIVPHLLEIADESAITMELRSVGANYLAQEMFFDDTIDAIIADSLTLSPILQSNPERLKVAKGVGASQWLSDEYLSIAIPENDHTLRNLVELSLQELARNGHLNELLMPLQISELPSAGHRILQWPNFAPQFQINPGS